MIAVQCTTLLISALPTRVIERRVIRSKSTGSSIQERKSAHISALKGVPLSLTKNRSCSYAPSRSQQSLDTSGILGLGSAPVGSNISSSSATARVAQPYFQKFEFPHPRCLPWRFFMRFYFFWSRSWDLLVFGRGGCQTTLASTTKVYGNFWLRTLLLKIHCWGSALPSTTRIHLHKRTALLPSSLNKRNRGFT